MGIPRSRVLLEIHVLVIYLSCISYLPSFPLFFEGYPESVCRGSSYKGYLVMRGHLTRERGTCVEDVVARSTVW